VNLIILAQEASASFYSPLGIIAIMSLLLAALTFISTQLTQRKTASIDYVNELLDRIKSLERDLLTARGRIHDLEVQNASQLKENIALLRQIAHLNDTAN
jgi:hypothetical protein